ncbi:hypothetical protein QUF64_15770 [Anaerolineales bacterium HSG6]|nr:hypothetical protein [Anaerolineales bacterium HSG6]
MKVQRITISIALALGMLVLFMVPIVAWQGAEEAHAQDVGAQAVPQMTVGITQTEFEVFSTGVSTIYLESTADITVTNIWFDLEVPDETVQLRGQPLPLAVATAAVSPATGTVTYTGKIYSYNQSGNRITFQWDWPISSGLVVSAGTKIGIIGIPWSGSQVGSDFVSIESADIDTHGSSYHGQPGNILDGIINVTRRQTYVRLDAGSTACGTNYDLDLGQVSSSLTNTTVHISADEVRGVDFRLVYDSSKLEVDDTDISGFVSNGGKADTSQPGVIVFTSLVADSSSPNNQEILEVTWKGLTAGSDTPYLEDVVLYDENGDQIDTPVVAYGDRTVADTLTNSCDVINIAAPDAELYFEDASLSVTAGSTANQDVRISGVDNICEVLFRVEFDETNVQVKDANENLAGVQVDVGTLFGDNVTVSENVVNNNQGTIDFRIRSQSALNTVDTPGQVAEITWEGLTGSTDLYFVQHSIFDCDNANVTHDVRADSDPGSITVSGTAATPTPTTDPNDPTATPTPTTDPNDPTTTPTPTTDPNDPTTTPTPTTNPNDPTATPTTDPGTGNITGRIRLEGSDAHTDFSIHADSVPCSSFSATDSNKVDATITPNSSGNDASFSIPAGTYQCLQVVREDYLSTQRSSPSGDLGYTELQAGDFNNDGTISIFDLAYIGDKYGKADGRADFNDDGTVDIFDISVVAGNYNMTGPLTY